jgi:hypothetical protein
LSSGTSEDKVDIELSDIHGNRRVEGGRKRVWKRICLQVARAEEMGCALESQRRGQ